MKSLSFLLLAVCSATFLQAQTTPPAPTGPVVTPEVHRKHHPMHPTARPPASAVPSEHLHLNTAERAAILKDKPPLAELPAFTVADRDGHPVSAKDMSHTKHWILLYRRENCLPCDRLMNVLAEGASGGLKGGQPYVIVVAGKTSDSLERVRANYSTMGDATWLSDRDENAYAALKPRGTPMIYAMEGSRIAWNVPGNLGNPAVVEKMTSAWITGSPASSTQTTSPAVVPANPPPAPPATK